MASINTRVKSEAVTTFTHGGAKASKTPTAKEELARAVMSTMLWEDTFYEKGSSIANRIAELVKKNTADDAAIVAHIAKHDMKMRHVPLFVAREMFRDSTRRLKAGTLLKSIITRADDMAEFLAMYWKDNKDEPLANQAKVALGEAFRKFDKYQLQKYKANGKGITMRDVLRICHPTPKTQDEKTLWKSIVDGTIGAADTWETALSAGASKADTFKRLSSTGKLGGLAALRNVRNMSESGMDEADIKKTIGNIKGAKLTPLNYVMSAKENPRFSKEIEAAMLENFSSQTKLKGKTVVLVDISGSMSAGLGGRTTASRVDAAKALAMILRERCEDVVIYATAGNDSSRVHATEAVPSHYRGFALGDAIWNMQRKLGGGGIFLRQAMDYVFGQEKKADRVIVITDEQDCDIHDVRSTDAANAFGTQGNYILNIASYENGIGYKKFTHINGFSDRVVDFISVSEDIGNHWLA